MKNFVILIPPSEGKTKDGTGKPLKNTPSSASPLIKKLSTYKGDYEKLLGVKGKALEAAVAANQSLLSSPTLPAIERYSGVVFNGLNYCDLSDNAKQYCQNHVRIVSGLFGLLKPLDPIPDYKLKIEKLDAQKYWRPIITEELKSIFVIDLLPQAHAKALNYDNGIRIDFKIMQNGKSKPAGHNGKHIKGRFIRWLCEQQVTTPDKFKKFKEDGFVFDGQNFIKSLP